MTQATPQTTPPRVGRAQDLTPVQLAWCRENMPSFRAANDAVRRRDADVAANWARFHPAEPEPSVITTMRRTR